MELKLLKRLCYCYYCCCCCLQIQSYISFRGIRGTAQLCPRGSVLGSGERPGWLVASPQAGSRERRFVVVVVFVRYRN